MSITIGAPRLGVALSTTGRLVREMNRIGLPERRDATAGATIWTHALMANGSIVSERYVVTPGGGLSAPRAG